jgi:hypothetical protein
MYCKLEIATIIYEAKFFKLKNNQTNKQTIIQNKSKSSETTLCFIFLLLAYNFPVAIFEFIFRMLLRNRKHNLTTEEIKIENIKPKKKIHKIFSKNNIIQKYF